MELLTAAQMRAIEKAAIDGGEVTGLELMERAGRGVVEAVLDWRPELAAAPGRAVVLCGPGNNGGDGFVVARLLREKGWEVDVFLYGEETKLPPDAALNARRWREIGEMAPLTAEVCDSLIDDRANLVIDALFGIGLSRDLSGFLSDFAKERDDFDLAHHGQYLVALDAPSGLDGDSGRIRGAAFDADLTITFHRAKRGHYLASGPDKSGEVAIVDIGLERDHRLALIKHHGLETGRGLGRFGCRLGEVWDEPQSKLSENGDHKYAHGHALVLAGGTGKGGAARLAARGALRIGAGLVTVAAPPDAMAENAARLDAIMLRQMK
ncbi:MAG: NAD(P)H-hydrate epimerase, partial [Pseudomonadota bacterium]